MLKIKSFIRNHEMGIWMAAIILAVYMTHLFVGTVSIISGTSMCPTFEDGDFVWVSVVHDDTELHSGDIVCAKVSDKLVIKRLSGLPGQTIESPDLNIPRTSLGEDEYYLIGDNYEASCDSRYFGPVSRDDIVFRYSGVHWTLRTLLITAVLPLVLLLLLFSVSATPGCGFEPVRITADSAGHAECVYGEHTAGKTESEFSQTTKSNLRKKAESR